MRKPRDLKKSIIVKNYMSCVDAKVVKDQWGLFVEMPEHNSLDLRMAKLLQVWLDKAIDYMEKHKD